MTCKIVFATPYAIETQDIFRPSGREESPRKLLSSPGKSQRKRKAHQSGDHNFWTSKTAAPVTESTNQAILSPNGSIPSTTCGVACNDGEEYI